MVLTTLHLQQDLGIPAGTAGLTLVPFSLGVVAGAALTRPIGRRLAAPRLGALGLTAIGVGIGVITLTGGPPPSVLVGGAIAGAGLGLASVAGNDLGTDVDDDLHAKISAMVEEEHALRKAHAAGSGPDEDELHRLRVLEEKLDRTWDLLRQRQARRDAGQDAGAAKERGTDVVEGYVG